MQVQRPLYLAHQVLLYWSAKEPPGTTNSHKQRRIPPDLKKKKIIAHNSIPFPGADSEHSNQAYRYPKFRSRAEPTRDCTILTREYQGNYLQSLLQISGLQLHSHANGGII